MSIPLAIQGIGVVGGFGVGNQLAFDAMQKGADAPNETMQVQTSAGLVDYPVAIQGPSDVH